MRGRQGFTLIELLLALALISILLIIVTPRTNIYDTYYKNMELNTLERDLYTIRSRAVSEGRTYSFNVMDDGYGYYIGNNNNKIIQRVNLDSIRILTSSHKGFIFTAQGSIANPNTIEIRDYNNERYILSVGVGTGKITLEKVE